MPPVIVAVSAFLVTVGVPTAIATFAATFAVNMLVTIGLNLAMRALAGKPKQGIRGDNMSVNMDPASPREVILGQRGTAGALVTHAEWGTNNEYIVLAFAVADHRCDSLVGAWWNGKRITIDPIDGHVLEARTGGQDYLWITFYNGDWNQTADADLVANAAGWTSANRGRGVAWVKVKARFNKDAHPNGLSGLFQFIWEIKGAPLYDRRLDTSVGGSGAQRFNDQTTWAWTDNAAVLGENILRGIRVEDTTGTIGSRTMDTFYGLGLTDSDLPFADNVSAMNSCDDAIPLLAGGTEKRYRASAAIPTDQSVQSALQDLLMAMGMGKLITGVGRWVFLPGINRTAVRTITDDDLRLDGPHKVDFHVPLDEAVNAVQGRFVDPLQLYQGIALPARVSASDEVADGGRKSTTADLNAVTSPTQGQRIHKIVRERARLQHRAKLPLLPEHADLEAGDWIIWISARYGWTKTWEIQSGGVSTEEDTFFRVDLDAAEISATPFAWTAATDEQTYTGVSGITSNPQAAAAVAGLTVTATTITSGTETVPAITMAWTNVTDPTAIAVQLEYRKVGTTTAYPISHDIDPASAAAQSQTVSENVLGGSQYEARGAVVYLPYRALVWSAWTATPTTPAAPTVVGSATSAGSVPYSGVTGGNYAPWAVHTSLD